MRGRSACRGCGVVIAARDNIPLLSFALLGGRCRRCQAPIPWRYPIVEVGTAAAFVAAFVRFGLTPAFALASAFLAALIAITAIDLEHHIIPNALALPGSATGLLLGPVAGLGDRLRGLTTSGPSGAMADALGTGHAAWLWAYVDAVLGIIVCGGILFAVIAISGWVYARTNPELPGGMGMGDLKLGAMLGAFLGWRLGLFALFVAVMAGGAVAAALLLTGRKGRKDAVPFGPFLAQIGRASWRERVW